MRGESRKNEMTLLVSGRPVGRRFEIVVNGKSVELSGTAFFYLFMLAHHCATAPGQWLRWEEMDEGHNQIRYVYRLRCELKANHVNRELPIANDKKGGYRLLLRPSQVAFDLQNLAEFPDVRIREMSKVLQAHKALDRQLESTVR